MATDANQLGNSPGNARSGLGLGMGLKPGQRQAFRNAANTGTLGTYLDQHPNQQTAFIQAQDRNPTLAGQYTGVNTARQQQPAAAPQNTGSPAAGAKGAGNKTTGTAKPAVGPSGTMPTGGPTQGIPSNEMGPSPTGYQDALNAQYGSGNPLGMRGNYSDPNNPIYAAAKRNYDQTMAAQRARFGASGLGNSGREALAEGEGASNLAAQIAQIGEQAFQQDKGTGLQAMLGAAQNQNQANQLALQANQQLSGLGTGLTGIGSQEQGIPNLGELMSFLGAFSNSLGSGNNRTKGANGFAFKQ